VPYFTKPSVPGGEAGGKLQAYYYSKYFCFSFYFIRYFISDLLGGWAAFTVSISIIGMLTAVIGDVASSFGCTVGLKDAVTALSFVAMGTSIPGQKPINIHSLQLCSHGNQYTRSVALSFVSMGTSIPGG